MRSRLKQQAQFGALIMVCALAAGLQARPQEVTDRPNLKESQGRGQEQGNVPKEPERTQVPPNSNDSAHAPEIDGSMIPTALALAGAGVVMLRARLRSR